MNVLMRRLRYAILSEADTTAVRRARQHSSYPAAPSRRSRAARSEGFPREHGGKAGRQRERQPPGAIASGADPPVFARTAPGAEPRRPSRAPPVTEDWARHLFTRDQETLVQRAAEGCRIAGRTANWRLLPPTNHQQMIFAVLRSEINFSLTCENLWS